MRAYSVLLPNTDQEQVTKPQIFSPEKGSMDLIL